MIYLASPYSDPSPAVRDARHTQAVEVTRQLIEREIVVFSPIVYSHQMASELGGDFESWRKFDFAMLDLAEELWVLTLDGWKESVGVAAEIEHARGNGIAVLYISESLEFSTPQVTDTVIIKPTVSGHPWQDGDDRLNTMWEQFQVIASTEAVLNEQVAKYCLAGWTCWVSGLLDTLHVGKQFAAVMYRVKSQTGKAIQ